jgi:hypothetical protein
MCGNEYRSIENPVLFGPDKLLTFKEQHSDVAFVFDQQVRDRTRLIDLFHGDGLIGQRLLRKTIFDATVPIREERKHRKGLVADRISNTQSRQCNGHDNLLEKRKTHRHGHRQSVRVRYLHCSGVHLLGQLARTFRLFLVSVGA